MNGYIEETSTPDEVDSNDSTATEGPGNLNSKLYENIPEDVIEEIHKRGRDQCSLTEKQDIQNIALDFGYDTLKALHKSDPISCQLIIDSLGNEVLYSKQQGVVDKEHPEIMENEFVLIIVTTAQERLFRERMNRTRLLTMSVDSTHGISGSDYHATTLVNIDNENLGFPDAVCISSKVNEQILTLYFNKIKEKFGILYANIFMSDGIPIFRNAWRKVMGSSSINKCFTCSFYVEKAWKKKIEAIPDADQESKITIYSICRTLLEVKDEQKFWATARAFMINLEQSGYTGFKNYFETSYLHENRITMWAKCYNRFYRTRVACYKKANNHIVALQKVLNVFFDRKKGKRLDKCILGILKLIDSRVSNRRIDPIRKRICGSNLARSVKEIDNGVFSVQSNNYENSQYLVKRFINCNNCKERCILCNACSHMYICECEDYNKTNLCKHVNAVTMYLNAVKKVEKKVEPKKPVDYGNEDDIIMDEVFEAVITEEVSVLEDTDEVKIQKINSILDIQDQITMQLSDKDIPHHIYLTIKKQLKQVKETLDKSSLDASCDNQEKENRFLNKRVPNRENVSLQLI
ncbi:unnamed protein product [Meganyctiphanes norvegica]|uniref:SWIM-type domain-containing protein n=1 Tax=Meganyctiphanes norvegica TaxID=48144 RepID=A0AAV2RJE8_MEGNR